MTGTAPERRGLAGDVRRLNDAMRFLLTRFVAGRLDVCARPGEHARMRRRFVLYVRGLNAQHVGGGTHITFSDYRAFVCWPYLDVAGDNILAACLWNGACCKA